MKRKYKKFNRISRKYQKRIGYDMFTYGDIKILPGNIGYVEIKDFNSTSLNKKNNHHHISFESVLNFFRNTNSIIIDFRENLGGYIYLSARFCSYFSDTPNSYFITTESVFRYDSNQVRKEFISKQKLFTSNDISNKLIGDKKIFILTSKRTFSAGELSTYKLKQLHSKTIIIGEKTTGGGNGYYGNTVSQYYSAVIPCIKLFDETNSNYNIEAKGITPDIKTSADSALLIAYHLSLSGNLDTIDSKIKYYRKQSSVLDDREMIFKKNYDFYVGNYDKVTITKQYDKLFMTYDLYSKQLLTPDAIDFFLTPDFEFIRFSRNKENEITEIQIKHKDGYLEKFHRQ